MHMRAFGECGIGMMGMVATERNINFELFDLLFCNRNFQNEISWDRTLHSVLSDPGKLWYNIVDRACFEYTRLPKILAAYLGFTIAQWP